MRIRASHFPAVLAAVSATFLSCSPGHAEDFDIIIERGRVVDGTGAPWYVADVGLKNGRIARIGRLIDEKAARRIGAEGLIVAPGFIDMMGQTVSPLLDDPKAALNLLTQGITTVNAGEGSSAAPIDGAEARAEGWRSMAEYFHTVELKGLSLNLAQTVGHTQVRRRVMGDENRKPAPDELTRMKDLVREAMEAGAIGLSTALIYPPAIYADTEEVGALASVAGAHGGRYFTHMRNEGDQLLEAMDEALEIGRKGSTPIHIFHLKTAGRDNWSKMDQAVAKIRAARAAGVEITADIYPYVNSGVYIESLIHPRHFNAGLPAFLARLNDEELRRTIRTEMEANETGWENWFKHTGRDWNKIIIGSSKSVSVRYRIDPGQSIDAAAKANSTDPWNIFFDLVRNGALVMPETMSDDNKRRLMREDFISFCTDAGPASRDALTSHPRAFGSFSRIFSRYVREGGVITLEQAVAKASAVAANEIMARDRGRIAEGLAADIIVFDYQKFTDRADFARPRELSEGMKHVFVNGEAVLSDGKLTNARPGRVLRGPGYRRDLAPPAIVTGEAVPEFAAVDAVMQELLTEHSIPGAAVAITDGGRLVYARGFGYGDVAAREKVTPESLFRIASISKPVTSATVFRLIEQGKLTLDSKVFEILDKYEPPAADAKVDPRLADITIRQLLQHSGGWDRDKSFDAMFRALDFARTLKVPPPAGPNEVIRNMMAQPLDFDPGVRQAYSNYGYCLLGRVIEKLTGQSYEDAVRERILDPSGARTMTLGRSLPEQRHAGEVRYYTVDRGPSVFDASLGQRVPYPYGGWYLEAMDSHGAWLASCLDLARFGVSFDDNGDGTLLQRASLDAMFARPSGTAGLDDKGQPKDYCYAAGWGRRESPAGAEFSHSGALSGTSTLLVKRPDGRNWTVLFNSRGGPRADFFPTALKPKMSRVLDEIKTWPAHDLFAKFPKHQPATQPPAKAEQKSPAPSKITSGGRERTWYLHAPPTLDRSKPAPLLFLFHGAGGNGLSDLAAYRWLADREQLLLVSPDGFNKRWNAGNTDEIKATDSVDDVSFVRDLVKAVGTEFKVDDTRIYAVGFSNGAALCHRLAVEAPDLFAAVAGCGATMPKTVVPLLKPQSPVSVQIMIGTEDPMFGRNGDLRGGSFLTAEETANVWAKHNACAGPVRGSGRGGFLRWSGTELAAEEVELWVVEGAGHTPSPGGNSWNAAQEQVEFLVRHARGAVKRALKVHSVWPFSAEEAKQRQTETASALKIPVERSIRLTDSVEVQFQLIPAGKFVMGSPESEDGHEGDERQRPETIHEPFYMMETQLTVAQFTALMQSPPSEGGAADLPAGIHYRDTVDKVLPALAKLAPPGWKVILPDHIRLEYAARAGAGTMNPGGNKTEDAAPFAWYRENSGGQVQPVARKSPNAWGLHDVIGNRWHWFWRAGEGYGDLSKDDHIVYGGHARWESGGNGVRLANIMISKSPEGARFALIRAGAAVPPGHPETKLPAK
jgi:N-acyl-D-amino-acid deacylase